MENLFKLLSLNAEEMNYFIGMVVGNADGNPERPVGEAVREAFGEIDQIRAGTLDPYAEVMGALFGTPEPQDEQPQDTPPA